jgi:hypothetical protein
MIFSFKIIEIDKRLSQFQQDSTRTFALIKEDVVTLQDAQLFLDQKMREVQGTKKCA